MVADVSGSTTEPRAWGSTIEPGGWSQRALATSRTQQGACRDQWELIIENSNAQSHCIAELRRELEVQRDKLESCSDSIERVDRMCAQHTQRIVTDLQSDMENTMSRLEKQLQTEMELLESHLVILLETKFKQQQDIRAVQHQEQEERAASGLWKNIRKEQHSHEVYVQDMLRKFSVSLSGQEGRAAQTQDALERVDRDVRAFMREHSASISSSKEEDLRNHCSSVTASLEAKLTRLQHQVGEVENRLGSHTEWAQGELQQLSTTAKQDFEAHAASMRDQMSRLERDLDGCSRKLQEEVGRLEAAVEGERGDRSVSLREQAARFEEELGAQSGWARGELRRLEVLAKEEQGARTAAHQERVARLELDLSKHAGAVGWVQGELRQLRASLESERDARGTSAHEWMARFERELDSHVDWVQGELRELSTNLRSEYDVRFSRTEKELDACLRDELRRLSTALGEECKARAAERKEEARRNSRTEAFMDELQASLRKVQDDFRGHHHRLIAQKIVCGPAEPMPCAAVPAAAGEAGASELAMTFIIPGSEGDQRSPERTWEARANDPRAGAEEAVRAAAQLFSTTSANSDKRAAREPLAVSPSPAAP